MVYYKSYRIVDGKPKWVIEDENGSVDKNPTNEQLKGLEKFPEKDGRSNPRSKKSNSELLEYLRQFKKENGRIPTVWEFNENPKYPNGGLYYKKFGSWNNALNVAGIFGGQKKALRSVGLNTLVKEHFENESKDLSGENSHSPCDGNGMVYYKSYRIVDGRSRWVIVDHNGTIIDRNPSKEILKNIIIDEDKTGVGHINTKCCKCRKSETYIRPNGDPEWLRYKDKRGIWDGESYVCKMCYSNDYQNSCDSSNNIKKLLANCRTGNLAKNSETGKGSIGEAVIANVRRLKIINIESNNFNSMIDLSCDNEYGIIQSKFSVSKFGRWEFSTGGVACSDTLSLLCIDRSRSKVKCTYMIPSKYVNVSSITISDTMKPRGSRWDKFRIGENPYNGAYQSLMYYLKDKEFFGIEDIKKWLDGGV